MSARRRAALVGGLVAVVCGGATATVVSGCGSGHSSQAKGRTQRTSTALGAPPVASPNRGVAAPSPGQSRAFRAFRRPRRAADNAAARNQELLRVLASGQADYGANPSLARVVLVVLGGAGGFFAVVPGRDRLCSVAVGGEQGIGGCPSSTTAQRDGLFQFGTAPPTGGRGFYVEGVLPDGAHNVVVTDTKGGRHPVSLSSDNGFLLVSGSPLKTLSWVAGNGARHREDIAVSPRP